MTGASQTDHGVDQALAIDDDKIAFAPHKAIYGLDELPVAWSITSAENGAP